MGMVCHGVCGEGGVGMAKNGGERWGSYATQVSTYASLGTAGGNGVGGSGLENGNSWCFGFGDYIVQNENVHSGKRVIIRAVRDWDPDSE